MIVFIIFFSHPEWVCCDRVQIPFNCSTIRQRRIAVRHMLHANTLLRLVVAENEAAAVMFTEKRTTTRSVFPACRVFPHNLLASLTFRCKSLWIQESPKRWGRVTYCNIVNIKIKVNFWNNRPWQDCRRIEPVLDKTRRERSKSSPYIRLKNSKRTSKCQLFFSTELTWGKKW